MRDGIVGKYERMGWQKWNIEDQEAGHGRRFLFGPFGVKAVQIGSTIGQKFGRKVLAVKFVSFCLSFLKWFGSQGTSKGNK